MALLLAAASLSSCAANNDDSSSSDTASDQTVYVGERSEADENEQSTGDEYIDQKKYYKAVHYGDVYTCQVIDRGGYVTKELELDAEPTVEVKNGNKIIKLTYGNTDELAETVRFYYDNANDRASVELAYVLDEFYAEDDNSLVTIFEDGVLYVRGIFYIAGELYKLPVPLTKSLADTDAPVISAKFVDSATVTVEYTTSSGEIFVETVSLTDN